MSGTYAIPLSGLREGRNSFYFEIGKEFFEKFEESEVKEGRLNATIEIDRRLSHADLEILISGSVLICCDRCLEMFFHPLSCKNRLIVNFGKSIDEGDPDIIAVPADEHELDLQQHIYEFIYLALPIKKVHPDDDNGNSTCDPYMLKKLEELTAEEGNESDARSEELKKLMNDN